jgi:Na+-transporting methylmalonyl-CoA/oxaloacetate decarboxylase gamma subunit
MQMQSPLIVALLITLIGMGLVFAAILLLWGVMDLLVKIAPGKGAFVLPKPREDLEREQQRRMAAAAAVAYALAHQRDSNQLHEFPEPPTALVSAWQAVMRAKMLMKRGHTR